MAVKTSPNIPPFVRFCTASVPMVFDNSMSYYECLCALTKFLQDDVINVINNNAQQLEGLLEGFTELKNYVDNYFDNLDVQEEINAKLDEMAEGGQLAGIIAQFLEAAPVFGYHTIAEMAAADNITNGCIARVIGNTSAAAGDGAYYTIRTKTGADDPDGVNLVAIGDTLVGVRVQDANRVAFNDYVNDNYINVKYNGAAGDGVTDDTTVLQGLINNNPHETLFFPAGTYLISEPLVIHTGNNHQVNLKLDKNAVITTSEDISFLLIVGPEEPTGDNAYHRYEEGSIVWVDGGIFDCGSASGAIKLTANQKQTKLSNFVIYNVNDYGVYVDRGINTSVSSDADISNASICGKGSENASTGIYLNGYDNKLSHLRVNGCQVGIDDHGGSYFTDVHNLYSASETPTVAQYEATKAFVFSGDGVIMCDRCYADTFAIGFEISGVGRARVSLNNCEAYWYTGVSGAKSDAIKVTRNDTPYSLTVTNFDLGIPSSTYGMDFDGLWLNGKQEYIAVYDFIKLSNINISLSGTLKPNDWLTCRSFYDKDSVVIHDAWTLTMEKDKWYPIAYLRGSSRYIAQLAMATDQIIEFKAAIGSTPTLSVTNILNNSHSNQYTLGICNAAQESDRGNMWGAYLCVKTSAADCSYNPYLASGLHGWNNCLFTKRNFNSNQPLNSPTVNASASFNA